MNRRKTAAVISGGGSLGACTVGTLKALNKNYDLVAGVSTGALMAPLVALSDWDRLITAYTSVTQDDIFSYNPFKPDGKINVKKALFRLLAGKPTLGETQAMRATVDKFLFPSDFSRLRELGKEAIVAAQETRWHPARVHYFSSLYYSQSDFADWMCASANAPGVTSIIKKPAVDGRPGEWVDAGLTELLSLKKVIELGAGQVDVFIHRVRPEIRDRGAITDFFHNAARLFSIMRAEIENDDLAGGIREAQINNVDVTVYYLPYKLADNSLIFDKKQMSQWVTLGMETAQDPARRDSYQFSQQLVNA